MNEQIKQEIEALQALRVDETMEYQDGFNGEWHKLTGGAQ